MKKETKKILIIILILIISMITFNRLSILLVRKGNGYGSDVLNFYKHCENGKIVII